MCRVEGLRGNFNWREMGQARWELLEILGSA
jgi:hypothetical protein